MFDKAFVFQFFLCSAIVIYFAYVLYSKFSNKYKHLKSIKKGDKFIIVEAVGVFGTIVYTSVTCSENDVKNKTMLLHGKYSNGNFFAKTYKYDAWNFKNFEMMQKVFDAIQEELKSQELEIEKLGNEFSLTECLCKSEELLAKAEMFEDAAKVRDIKNKISKQ